MRKFLRRQNPLLSRRR
jgi:hypothetical protein